MAQPHTRLPVGGGKPDWEIATGTGHLELGRVMLRRMERSAKGIAGWILANSERCWATSVISAGSHQRKQCKRDDRGGGDGDRFEDPPDCAETGNRSRPADCDFAPAGRSLLPVRLFAIFHRSASRRFLHSNIRLSTCHLNFRKIRSPTGLPVRYTVAPSPGSLASRAALSS